MGIGSNQGTKKPPHNGIGLYMNNREIKYFYGKFYLSAIDCSLNKKRLFYLNESGHLEPDSILILMRAI